jgi:tetratricopeptide (TPR) repeat protein
LKQICTILLLAFCVYANTLGHDFNLDDGVLITGNKFTKQGLKGIPEILSHDTFYGYFGDDQFLDEGRYRPLAQVVFAILYQFFGLNAFVDHLFNILAYAACCILLYRLLRRLFREQEYNWISASFLTTILYVVHPLHTEVVANIKGLDEIASFIFCILAAEQVLDHADTRTIKHLFYSGALFFLAMMSKENAVTFIAVIPLMLWFFREVSGKTIMSGITCLVIGFGAYMMMRYQALGFFIGHASRPELLNDPFLYSTTSEKYATIFYTWGKYFQLLVFPHPLTHDYYPKQIPIVGWTEPLTVFAIGTTLFLAAFALIRFYKKDILSFAILFFFITFSVSSNLLVPVGTFMNERFMFMPSLGFCLALVLLIQKLVARFGQKAVIASVLVLVAAGSARSIARNPAWKDGLTLFTTDVRVSSESAKCNTSAGGLMMEEAIKMPAGSGKIALLKEAVTYMEKAVEIHPASANAWLILGRAQIELGDLDYAERATLKCLQQIPGHADARTNMLYLAQQNGRLGRAEEAIRCYQHLRKIDSANPAHVFAVAELLEKNNQLQKALLVLDTLASTNNPAALNRMAEIQGRKLGNIDSAIVLYESSYRLQKNDVVMLENLGVLYGMKKRYRESVRMLEQALRIQPANAGLYRNIATSYNNLGLKDSMNYALTRAMELEGKKN